VLLSISYPRHSISQQVFGLLAHHHLPLRPSQGEILDTFFPEQSGDPLTRNWTRQPEVYCLFYPKHTTITTTAEQLLAKAQEILLEHAVPMQDSNAEDNLDENNIKPRLTHTCHV
jgi:hypothetical protein